MTGDIQIIDGDELKVSASALNPVGARGMTKDGRVYRYGSAAAAGALAPGKLAVAATKVDNHENIAVQAAAAIGAKSVSVTLGATAATANQYAGGYLVVNDATGEGIAYPINGHPAHAGSGTLTVSLDQPIQVALTTSSEVSLIANPWSNAVISVTDQLDMPVGIPNVNIPASNFGWLQTRGVCAALADETLAAGENLTIGSSVAGALEENDAVGEPNVGVAIQPGVDTEYRAVFLQID
jgi:hypothetical protein